MSEPVELIDVWRRTLDATVKFYSTIGELAVDYLQTLVSSINLEGTGKSKATGNESPNVATSHPTHFTKAPQPVPTMVLEAENGAQAVGIFLVENLLSRTVTASPAASEFLGENGRKINPSLIFHPPSITLAPGEQILVRVVATFDHNIKPGIRYQGEISVPGLLGTSIPLALCKTENSNAPETNNPAGKSRRARVHSPRSRPKTTKKLRR